jgi:toxin ParE1/3/4
LDDPIAGARLLQRFDAAEILLGRFPFLGRVGRVEGTRELVLARTSYMVVYRVERGAIVILDIRHDSRKPS